jgi:hypothetical protein
MDYRRDLTMEFVMSVRFSLGVVLACCAMWSFSMVFGVVRRIVLPGMLRRHRSRFMETRITLVRMVCRRFLIATSHGLVLIDGDLPESASLIEAHIKALGFRVSDVHWILNSHAHSITRAALRSFSTKRRTSIGQCALVRMHWSWAVLILMIPIRSCTHLHTCTSRTRVVRDGETIDLGGVEITAHATPGHTPGSMSWTWRSCEGNTCVNIAYADSLTLVQTARSAIPMTRRIRIALKISAIDCDRRGTAVRHSAYAASRSEQLLGQSAASPTNAHPDALIDTAKRAKPTQRRLCKISMRDWPRKKQSSRDRISRIIGVFDKPQAREQFRVDRETFVGACEQPRASFLARHFMHDDALAFVATAFADFHKIMRAGISNDLAAHAGRRRSFMHERHATAAIAGFFFQLALRGQQCAFVVLVGKIANQARGHFDGELLHGDAVLLYEQNLVFGRDGQNDDGTTRDCCARRIPSGRGGAC